MLSQYELSPEVEVEQAQHGDIILCAERTNYSTILHKTYHVRGAGLKWCVCVVWAGRGACMCARWEAGWRSSRGVAISKGQGCICRCLFSFNPPQPPLPFPPTSPLPL